MFLAACFHLFLYTLTSLIKFAVSFFGNKRWEGHTGVSPQKRPAQSSAWFPHELQMQFSGCLQGISTSKSNRHLRLIWHAFPHPSGLPANIPRLISSNTLNPGDQVQNLEWRLYSTISHFSPLSHKQILSQKSIWNMWRSHFLSNHSISSYHCLSALLLGLLICLPASAHHHSPTFFKGAKITGLTLGEFYFIFYSETKIWP